MPKSLLILLLALSLKVCATQYEIVDIEDDASSSVEVSFDEGEVDVSSPKNVTIDEEQWSKQLHPMLHSQLPLDMWRCVVDNIDSSALITMLQISTSFYSLARERILRVILDLTDPRYNSEVDASELVFTNRDAVITRTTLSNLRQIFIKSGPNLGSSIPWAFLLDLFKGAKLTRTPLKIHEKFSEQDMRRLSLSILNKESLRFAVMKSLLSRQGFHPNIRRIKKLVSAEEIELMTDTAFYIHSSCVYSGLCQLAIYLITFTVMALIGAAIIIPITNSLEKPCKYVCSKYSWDAEIPPGFSDCNLTYRDGIRRVACLAPWQDTPAGGLPGRFLYVSTTNNCYPNGGAHSCPY